MTSYFPAIRVPGDQGSGGRCSVRVTSSGLEGRPGGGATSNPLAGSAGPAREVAPPNSPQDGQRPPEVSVPPEKWMLQRRQCMVAAPKTARKERTRKTRGGVVISELAGARQRGPPEGRGPGRLLERPPRPGSPIPK